MLEIAVLGLTILTAAGAAGADAHRRAAASRALKRYARARGYAFSDDPKAPRVEGALDDVVFTIDVVRLGGRITTRAWAPSTRTRPPRVAVLQRSGIARILERRGRGSFDRAFQVHPHAHPETRAMVGDAASRFLVLDNRQGVRFTCDGEKVTLTWADVETIPGMLDVARDLVVAGAKWERAGAPYR